MHILKKTVKAVVKTVAMLAALVFFFDNRISGIAGTVMLCALIILIVFGIGWMVLEEYWPDNDLEGDSSREPPAQ